MRNKFHAVYRRRSGFSLVEAIVACFILVLFAVGISSAIAYATSSTSKATVQSDSAEREKELISNVIAVLSSGSYTDFSDANRDDNILAIKKTVGFCDGDGNQKTEWAGYTLNITKSDNGGFYITLTHDGKTVTGYASDTEGVFYVGN